MMNSFRKKAIQLAYGVPRPAAPPFSPEKVRKILLVRRNGIGDMICALPLIRSIRAAWPEVRMDILAGEKNACVLEGLGLVERIHLYHRGEGLLRNHYLNLPRIIKPILEEQYDLLIAIKGGFSKLLAVISYASRIPWRLGYVPSKGHPMDFCFNLKIELPREREHQIDSCLRFLEPLKISTASRDLGLHLSTEHQEYADKVMEKFSLGKRPFVLFNVSADRPASRWIPSAIAQTALGLEKLFDLPMLLCGLERDRELLQATVSLAPESICGKVEPPSIHHFAALTSRSRFLMCGDGGPMHVAAAMKIPVFVLFSATDPRIWGPQGVPFGSFSCQDWVCKIQPTDVLTEIKNWMPTWLKPH